MSQKDFPFNNSRIVRMKDASLVVLCDRVDSSQGGENGKGTVNYLWKGDAEGEHWSEPIILPFCAICPDKLRELKNGRLIFAAHNQNPETNKLEVYMWYSDDKGFSWSDRITIGADSRYNLCEVNILELDDGTLIAFMRENSGMGYDCMKSISHDGGLHWEGVFNTPIPACHHPVAGFLNDGSIMITYRFMQGGKGWLGSWTQNLFAAFINIESAISTDRRQQSARIFPLDYDRSTKSDLGYTGWVQFDDGEIYVVNYIVDDAPKAQIRGYSFVKENYII
jgi:sialidase-1